MFLSKGGVGMPKSLLLLAPTFLLIASCRAGPVGPLPNVTSADLGLKEGSCAVGDVVYMVGDEFPGSTPCERCACGSGGVRCARQRCEPQAGCKAVHRPDQCCPIYQCECEQEGRVYANGEKLVDPANPCRVCYCQGGEMVCRRIACFVRDDCLPRLVPGRCCPEYDNCPLRGVTAIPGVAPTTSSTTETISSSAPQIPKENVRQEITIKEITPVSEIPAITEVKIKEILPSSAIEVADDTSSKSPVIVREATSEKPSSNYDNSFTADAPLKIDFQPVEPSASAVNPAISSEIPDAKTSESIVDIERADLSPSKIKFSTQDTANEETSVLISLPTLGVPVIPDVTLTSMNTKTSVVEEDDGALFDHNPAFPPIPDDLSVVGNHEDEIIQEQNVDGVLHVDQETSIASSAAPSPETNAEQPNLTTLKELQNPTTTTEEPTKIALNNIHTATFTNTETTNGPETTSFKDSPMLNLRTAIPTEILNLPSLVEEEITEDESHMTHFDFETSTATKQENFNHSTPETPLKFENTNLQTVETPTPSKEYSSSTVIVTEAPTTNTPTQATSTSSFSTFEKEVTTRSMQNLPESTNAPDIIAFTERSSTSTTTDPFSTSNENLRFATEHDFKEAVTSTTTENIFKEKVTSTTTKPIVELATTKISSSTDSEVITVSRTIPSSTENQSFENVETTEFILTSLGSSESATDAVELIKISAEPETTAHIIEPERKESLIVTQRPKYVLTDFINLVGDVAAIGDHTETPESKSRIITTGISESEELIPINVGYKSKNSNPNVNSITEVPIKTKTQSVIKQKVVEIEGDDGEGITDSLPPNDKVEPTTRRPIIDKVSDDSRANKTDKTDIEIITKSYVPAINRRPTKVVMKKNNEKPLASETTESPFTSALPGENETEITINVSSETGFTGEPENATTTPDSTSTPHLNEQNTTNALKI